VIYWVLLLMAGCGALGFICGEAHNDRWWWQRTVESLDRRLDDLEASFESDDEEEDLDG
jgi:hypothetical protein